MSEIFVFQRIWLVGWLLASSGRVADTGIVVDSLVDADTSVVVVASFVSTQA